MRNVVAALIATASLTLAGCQSASAATAGKPAAPTGWPEKRQDNAMGIGEPPPFPEQLKQWTLQNRWSVMPRAFEDQQTSEPGPDYSDYPATMNGCSAYRLLIRWRTVDTKITVTARLTDEAGNTVLSDTGTAGFMDTGGCITPTFEVARSTDGGNLTDVTTEVEQWVAAP